MKPTLLLSFIGVFASSGVPVDAATSVVETAPIDWLEVSSGGSALVDDSGRPTASLDLNIDRGVLLEGAGPGYFRPEFWDSLPEILSIGDEIEIVSTNLRVTPDSFGMTEYDIVLEGDIGNSIIALGGLYGNSNTGLLGVLITGFHNSFPIASPLDFLGTYFWSDGVSNFDSELVWQPETSLLLAPEGTLGESGFAFFKAGENLDRLDFRFQHQNLGFPGDSVSLAVGMVVPEPSSTVLIFAAITVFVQRRNRASASPTPVR